ncbi:MAG TPA: PorT family protein [Bacteroidetes bacterium]|nr:PorT family protein [Bacteroidota bacterium]
MKKIVAVIAFFLAFQIGIFAQYGDLRLGFQISPMVSFMSTDDNTINGNGANLGLKLGMMGEYYFRENYAFIGGLGFSFNSGGTLRYESFSDTWQKSELPANVTAPFPGGTELKYNLQYVEIPFGLKFRTKEFGYFRYYAEIPVFTLGFNSQARGAISYTNVNEDKIDIKNEVIGISLSWGAGGGFEYGLSESTALVGGISFQQLFTDVSKNYKPNVDTKTQITHIVLRLGVMF